MNNYMYWPAGQAEPVRCLFQKDWVHPETNLQAGKKYYDDMSVSERVSLDVYLEIKMPHDPNKKYTRQWQKNNDGTVKNAYIETGLKDIGELKELKLSEVSAMREQVSLGGCVVLTKNVATDQETQNKINMIASALSQGESYPANGIPFYTMEGDKFNINQAQFATLTRGVAMHLIQTSINAEAHEDAVMALNTQQEVVDYDITIGWPSNP